ncbi:Adenine DNA glycosylase [bacterium HR36]|nr:Adenine DNA glycosylase [bacterium HR36]
MSAGYQRHSKIPQRSSSTTEYVQFPDLPQRSFARRFRSSLCRWFVRHARDFPWRRTRDPYAIWVSEVMLQQTQAATVVPYFVRFLRSFPDVQSLARASVEEVLHLWQGLGYYRRALLLHNAAQQLVRDHSSQFPRDPAQWQELPGIGRYTAHAILSQAFDLRLPIIEANSARVYARIFACTRPLSDRNVQKWLWRVAEELLPARSPGLFNQAIMELGATICLPRQPLCLRCPVAAMCLAHRLNRVRDFPVPPSLRHFRYVDELVVLIRRGDRWLVLQRASQANRWPLLWEFPHAPTHPGESSHQAAIRIARELTGLRVTPSHCLGAVRFAVTQFRFRMEAWLAIADSSSTTVKLTPTHQSARWCNSALLPRFTWSSPQRKLLALLNATSPE